LKSKSKKKSKSQLKHNIDSQSRMRNIESKDEKPTVDESKIDNSAEDKPSPIVILTKNET
jgi:hypothetical protein